MSYGGVLSTETERFRAAKPNINRMDPHMVFFPAPFFGFQFRDGI